MKRSRPRISRKFNDRLVDRFNKLRRAQSEEKIRSVATGWQEARSGQGEVVTEDDDFFHKLRQELKEREGRGWADYDSDAINREMDEEDDQT